MPRSGLLGDEMEVARRDFINASRREVVQTRDQLMTYLSRVHLLPRYVSSSAPLQSTVTMRHPGPASPSAKGDRVLMPHGTHWDERIVTQTALSPGARDHVLVRRRQQRRPVWHGIRHLRREAAWIILPGSCRS
jgi:hypothetical protein